jgi:hypothetical protein
MKKMFGPSLLATVSAGFLSAASAHAATNLVTNGDFETATNANGQLAFNTVVADWSVPALSGSYTFIFAPGTADTTGSVGQYGTVKIWGPGDGSANGLPASSPDGGNFVGADPAFHNGALSQTISGLTVGKTYELSFDWAGAQQFGYNGHTTEGWQVSLGSDTQSTGTIGDKNHGFTGWRSSNFFFTASNTSELLSFLALGGPNASLPPLALLDSVSLTAVPEPATWAVMLVGFGGIGAAIRTRRRQAATAS